MKNALVALLLLAGCGTAPELTTWERGEPLRRCSPDEKLDAAAGRVGLSVRAIAVPRKTADTLGAFTTLAGAGTHNPFLAVALGKDARARIDALLAEKKARLAGIQDDLVGRAGEWLTTRGVWQGAEISGIAWTSSSSLTVGIERRLSGLAVRAAVRPAEDALGSVSLSLRVHERASIGAGFLTARAYGDNTALPVEIPGIIERRAEDTVLLGPDDALALVGATGDPEWIRVILLAPVVAR